VAARTLPCRRETLARRRRTFVRPECTRAGLADHPDRRM